jgi:hypothetical protein
MLFGSNCSERQRNRGPREINQGIDIRERGARIGSKDNTGGAVSPQ